MKKPAAPSPGQQEQLNAYFQSQAPFWKAIYASGGVYARIHQARHKTALAWVDSLALLPGARALDVGCGAGYMSVELARRGFAVHAIDAAPAMLEQARHNAEAAGVTFSLGTGDVTALSFDDQTFDLVVALGVLPWLEHPVQAIREIARVTRPGGHIIASADNRIRLNALLDPLLNPLLAPLKRSLKRALDRVGLRHLSSKDVGAASHSRRFINRSLAGAGLTLSSSRTLGFGPFTLFRRGVIPEPLGIKLDLRLQSLADRGIAGFRSTGSQYLVLAEKSDPWPGARKDAGAPGSDTVTV